MCFSLSVRQLRRRAAGGSGEARRRLPVGVGSAEEPERQLRGPGSAAEPRQVHGGRRCEFTHKHTPEAASTVLQGH